MSCLESYMETGPEVFSDRQRKLDNGLVVRSDSTILDKRKNLFVVTVIGDSDTDRLVSVEKQRRQNSARRRSFDYRRTSVHSA